MDQQEIFSVLENECGFIVDHIDSKYVRFRISDIRFQISDVVIEMTLLRLTNKVELLTRIIQYVYIAGTVTGKKEQREAIRAVLFE